MNSKDSIHLAGSVLGKARHVCAFFNSPEEEYKVLLPFIKEGMERSERAAHVVNGQLRSFHLRQLEAAGIDTEGAAGSGQLEVRSWEEAYLRQGCFDQNAMLSLIQEMLQAGRDRGYHLTRFVANMEWAMEDRPGVRDIIEYEARLNYVLPKYDDPVICTYSLRRFGAGTIVDILRTHPVAIVGGIVQENPYYVPPDEFLTEMRRPASVSETSNA